MITNSNPVSWLTHSPRVNRAAFLFAAMFAGSALAQPTITNLGVLNGGNASYANAISADGSAVTGSSGSSAGQRAFRWTAAGGMENLDVLAGFAVSSGGTALSVDGAVVTGASAASGGSISRAFRWTAATGMQNIGVLGTGSASGGTAISADGSVIVGFSYTNGFFGFTAIRWTAATGMQNLGLEHGANANAISADTSVVVGTDISNDGFLRAFRWTSIGGRQLLSLPIYADSSEGYVTSADGSVVAGYVADYLISDTFSAHAFRWSGLPGDGGMVDLGTLDGGNESYAYAISADGSVVVGTSGSSSGDRAFLWASSLGMVDLNSFLLARGVNLTGWTLKSARGISADGSAIVGEGTFNGADRAFLVQGVTAVHGPSALDGFDPNANAPVQVVVVQPDGKLIIVGNFTTLAPNGGATLARNHIARLNPDGSLDAAFNPNANGTLYAVALQPDGKILVGGIFTSIGGQTRTNLARLNAITGLADSFIPNANGEVDAFVVLADGNILVGGVFTGIGGQVRNGIARLDGNTGLADAFNPNATGSVYAIVLQADGRILVAGTFTQIGGQPRNRIARLDATTGLADSFNPNANDIVYALALQADGKILAAGNFSGANSIGGQTRNHIARIDATTGLADAFDPNANDNVYTLAVQPDGRILAGGNFITLSPNGGGAVTCIGLARLNPDGTIDPVFSPNANGTVLFVTVQPDGKILTGGAFTTLAPSGGAAVTRNCLARLETDGRLDRTFDPIGVDQLGGQVLTTFVQTDGKIIISGDFTTVLGVTRNGIARLNTDGTLDTAFDPNCIGSVTALAVQADGKIVVVGAFLSIGGQARTHIARLDATTGLPDSFSPNADNTFSSVAVQADGKILLGGFFSSIGGQPRNGIARLHATTGLADSFNPNASAFSAITSLSVQADGMILAGGQFSSIGGQFRTNLARLNATTGLADSFNPNPNGSEITTVVVQADGKILVSGSFTTIGGQTRTNLARLDAATGVADSFNPNADNAVLSIAVQTDGKVLAGGFFTSIGGQTRNYIARLDATTGLADSFNPDANSYVESIALQVDGKILVGGYFSNIGGQPRALVARLNNDTAALQNLTATPTTVTWTRGGSSQQFTRVTFESSTNNVNYTSLGNGTPSGSNWTLPGLNLATGQNLYLRARGHFGSGFHNGSQSIQESVRNVFLATPPPRLNIQRSAPANVVLSWATNVTGFTLESNTNLNANVWSVVSPPPAVSGTNHVVTNAISGPARFFRLRQP